MDNAGDWLYIVFLIIAAVSGLFSSKNKKKNRPDILGQPDKEIVTNDQPSTGKGFWEILEEMEYPRPKPQAPPQPQRKTQKQRAEKPKTLRSAAPSPFLTEESSIPNNITSSSVLDPVEDEISILPEEPFRNIDELKKAVIYTEILNRKY